MLNESLKEARAKSDYEKSVLATKQAEDAYLSFKLERESLENSIVSEVIGSVVTQSDLDEMN